MVLLVLLAKPDVLQPLETCAWLRFDGLGLGCSRGAELALQGHMELCSSSFSSAGGCVVVAGQSAEDISSMASHT